MTEQEERCAEALPELLRREEKLIGRLSSAPEQPDVRPASIRAFRRLMLDTHDVCGRHDLPWRLTRDPYAVLVSEVMLQQTQVPRVAVVFPRFTHRFPTFEALAAASLTDVLEAWAGMGYNRRALSLKRLAEEVVGRYGGELPHTLEALDALPGIGRATAAAVLASAFGIAEPYIETNIRAVVLHFFFHDDCDVPDSAVLPVVAATLDVKEPRIWYYALMDYGNQLKRRHANPCRRSRHHMTQAEYRGSMRQVRGTVLRALVEGEAFSAEELADVTGMPLDKVTKALAGMQREGLVARDDAGAYRVA